MAEPVTLYKLMILYMLDRVNMPMTGAQFQDFFLTREYSSYFSLQQALSELEQSGLIRKEELHSSTRYEITEDGTQTLGFFGKKISQEIRNDIDSFLHDNHLKIYEEVSVISDYYRTEGPDYTVHCEVREGESKVIVLELSAPDEETARHMSSQWKGKSEAIYTFLMRELLGENS